MIIVKLMGGMGNQMFQYALGRNLSIKYQTRLMLDLSFLKRRDLGSNFVYRDYDLDLYHIDEHFYTKEIKESKIINKLNRYFFIPYKGVYISKEKRYAFSPEVLIIPGKIKANIYLDGYWQSYKYFESISEVIRKDFEFRQKVTGPAENMMGKIINSNSVMINVRRDDYLNTDVHGVMGLEYIMRGVDIIRARVKNPHFFIFSDDLEWCEANIKLDHMTIVDHRYSGSKYDFYLQLMKACKHFIIPNSTFAWWAAWLNTNPDKIVIAPKQWFAEEERNSQTKDLIPKSWIRI